MFSKKKKNDVFVRLSDLSKKIHKSVVFFDEFINDFEDVEEKSSKMKELETECDLMTHKVIEALKASKEVSWLKTERYELIKVLDNIVDYIEEVANRLYVFDVKEIRSETMQLSRYVVEATEEIEELFSKLLNYGEFEEKSVRESVININRIENEGDVVYRRALARLFKNEKDTIELIKWKHIFEQLENSIDACEDVANILESAML